MRGSSGPPTISTIEACPKCNVKLKKACLNSLRAHLNKVHGLSAEEAYLSLRDHPGPCIQCNGPVKFMTFQTGFERLCGVCNKKNSQLRGAENRRKKALPAWNKGLTEEMSESVRKAAQGCRNYIQKHGHWNLGKTKENSSFVALSAKLVSKTLTEKWKSEKHWTQHGHTSKTDERIRRRSRSIGDGVRANHWSKKSDSEIIKRSIVETRKRLIEAGINSPYRLKHDVIEQYVKNISNQWIVSDFKFAGYNTPVFATCKTCYTTLQTTFSILYRGKLCQTCNPANYSKWQREIYEFVTTIDPESIPNDRKLIAPLELDVLSMKHKLAIECNGLYWHSEAVCDDNMYHQNKSDRASEAGISLFHVFEDEWRDMEKREIIKSMLRVKLGNVQRLAARKLNVCSGHPSYVAAFLTDNHIDGNVPASKAFWLEDKAKNITCALTLRKPHQQTKWGSNTIELARVATVRDTIVVGGMSRLIKAATLWARAQGYNTMITYRDTRLGGTGNAYKASGFTLSHHTNPRFWWTNGTYRIDRFAVRAIPNVATQEEMSFEHKLFKIFGCSNVVYALDLTPDDEVMDSA